MKIQNFQRQTVKNLRSEIENALAEISSRYGIDVNVGNARFSNTNVDFKLTLNVLGEGGTVITAEGKAFERVKNSYGFGHLSVGDSIKIDGSYYTVTGFNSRRRSYPISFVDNSGRSFKCSIKCLIDNNPSV
tara:strand:+ start:6325 stop:6720 length:396 start_codon:yes stop_codon:yes gene_type:complete